MRVPRRDPNTQGRGNGIPGGYSSLASGWESTCHPWYSFPLDLIHTRHYLNRPGAALVSCGSCWASDFDHHRLHTIHALSFIPDSYIAHFRIASSSNLALKADDSAAMLSIEHSALPNRLVWPEMTFTCY
jgi:hypothetical protein